MCSKQDIRALWNHHISFPPPLLWREARREGGREEASEFGATCHAVSRLQYLDGSGARESRSFTRSPRAEPETASEPRGEEEEKEKVEEEEGGKALLVDEPPS